MTRVRAAIAIAFTLVICIGFMLNIISTDAFMGVAGMAIMWWFKSEEK